MNIAVLHNIGFPHSRNKGSENYMRGISLALAKRGHEVTVICHANEYSNYKSEIYSCDGTRINIIRTAPLNELTVKGQLRYMKDVFNILRREKYDILHCINPFSSVLPANIVKKLGRKSIVVYDLRINWIRASYELGYLKHYLIKPLIQAIELACLKYSDKVVAITHAFKSDLIEVMGLTPEKVMVSPSGVDLAFFSKANMNHMLLWKEKLGISKEDMAIGYLGVIDRKRKLKTIIQAFLELRKETFSGLKLIFVGWGPDLELYRAFVGKRDDIIFVGEVPRSHIPSLYGLFDVGICTTPAFMARYSSPLKALEYMAMGVPFVANNVEAYRELGLADGKNCLFFRSDDSEDLKKKLRMLILDENLRNVFKEETRALVSRYSWERIVDRLIQGAYRH